MRSFIGALLLASTFAVSSAAAATVIDVVVRDVGWSEGRLGGESDPLQVGDVVGIDFVLNHNPHPEFPSDDGYLLSSMDLDLVATGSGWLYGHFMCKCGFVVVTWHEDFDTVHPQGPHSGDELPVWELEDNAYEGFTADSVYGVQGPAILFQGLVVHADAPGTIVVDLSIGGLTEYSEYGGWPGPGNPWDWIAATDEDLGDLTLHVAAEPGAVPSLSGWGLATLTLLLLGAVACATRGRG
jgi:hypothetical protein